MSFVSWRNHIRDGRGPGRALDERLDPGRPPHVGVLLGNATFFCTVLVAAALSGIVPVGLNPTRRGCRTGATSTADCQLVLAADRSARTTQRRTDQRRRCRISRFRK